MPKSYKATTGVDQFHYGILDGTDAVAAVERVEFLQDITVEMPQDPVRAYGDNKTAEIAVSNGNITVSSAFHKIPKEDKVALLGLEESADGIVAYGPNDAPPYAAVVFSKTREDGGKEWVGLPKGIFLRPNVTGSTKSDSVEFTPEEISAEFMDRDVPNFDEEKSVLMGYDEPGSTAARDAIFTAVFGQSHPDAEPVV